MRLLAPSLIASALLLPALGAQPPAASIDLPADARPLLQAQGDGVQIYTCAPSPAGLKWTLKAPDAKLLDASGKTIGHHFAGPTWKLTGGSQVQGEFIASKPSPQAGSVAWLLLRARPGTATGSLANVAFIRRTDTRGGVAPASGCQRPHDSGRTARVPYTATYTFYAEK